MQNKSINEMFHIYLKAIKIEYEQESTYHEYLGVNKYLKYLPRVHVIIKKLKKSKIVFSYFVPIFIFFYFFLGYPIIIIYNLLKNLILNLFYKKITIDKNIYFKNSESKYFYQINKNEPNYPNSVVYLPHVKQKKNKSSNIKYISLFNITSSFILIKAALYSFIFISWLIFTKKNKLVLFSYTAFEWFWIYFCFNNIQINSIWITNHYDRWTVLASNLKNINVTLIQHGQLFFRDYINNVNLFPDFTYKIKNIKTIYSFNTISENYFKKYIDLTKTSFFRFKPNLEIINWRNESKNKFRILIIGHQGELKFQMKLSKFLLKEYKDLIDICYKYHPTQKNRIDNINIWEEFESNKIPRANLIISYGSSIDDEISDILDCEFQYYDFRQRDNINGITKEIRKKIDNFSVKNSNVT